MILLIAKVVAAILGVFALVSVSKAVARGDHKDDSDLPSRDRQFRVAQIRFLICFCVTLAVIVAIVLALVLGASDTVLNGMYALFVGMTIATGVLWGVADDKNDQRK